MAQSKGPTAAAKRKAKVALESAQAKKKKLSAKAGGAGAVKRTPKSDFDKAHDPKQLWEVEKITEEAKQLGETVWKIKWKVHEHSFPSMLCAPLQHLHTSRYSCPALAGLSKFR